MEKIKLWLRNEDNRLLCAAKTQAEEQEYTKLQPPLPIKVLFVCFDRVTFKGKDYKMTAAQKEYLHSVAQNFKCFVESAANNNIEVLPVVEFCDRRIDLPTPMDDNDHSYIKRDMITEELNSLRAAQKYDSVLCTSALPGEVLGASLPGGGGFWGMSETGVDTMYGYSYFCLIFSRKYLSKFYSTERIDITDFSRATALSTCCAIHEWLHQFEAIGNMLNIDFPNVHAYQGAAADPSFADYEPYHEDENGDWTSYFKDFLSANVLYKRQKLIGMYPIFWALTPRYLDRNRFIGKLKNAATQTYLTEIDGAPALTLSVREAQDWIITPQGSSYKIWPISLPSHCLNVAYAEAKENNYVQLYPDIQSLKQHAAAQHWHIQYLSGDLSFHFASDTNLVLTLNPDSSPLLILTKEDGSQNQRWISEDR